MHQIHSTDSLADAGRAENRDHWPLYYADAQAGLPLRSTDVDELPFGRTDGIGGAIMPDPTDPMAPDPKEPGQIDGGKVVS